MHVDYVVVDLPVRDEISLLLPCRGTIHRALSGGRSFSSDISATRNNCHPDRSGRLFPPLADASAGRAMEGSAPADALFQFPISIFHFLVSNFYFLSSRATRLPRDTQWNT